MPPTRRRESPPRGTSAPHANEVHLVGRLAVEPVHRELPSGDLLVSFRLVVDRAATGRGTTRRVASNGSGSLRVPTVDTLECAAWRKDVQRSLSRAVAGDVLEVHGALRRRFWRTGGGAASRSEVEVTTVRRVTRSG